MIVPDSSERRPVVSDSGDSKLREQRMDTQWMEPPSVNLLPA